MYAVNGSGRVFNNDNKHEKKETIHMRILSNKLVFAMGICKKLARAADYELRTSLG